MPKEKDESDGSAGDVTDEAIAEDKIEPPATPPEPDDERQRPARRVRSKIRRVTGKTRYLN